MPNNQPPEKRLEDPDLLQVHSIFKTIQGEGPFAGTPAIFIRLAGCSLACPNCDTDYTSSRRYMRVDKILEEVLKLENKAGFIVITGGEPFRQDIKDLMWSLFQAGYFVQVETNGTIKPPLEPPLGFFYSKNISSRHGIYVVCSPKTPSINPVYNKISCAFKYVMGYSESEHDGLPFNVLGLGLTKQVARPDKNFTGLIYLQPEDLKDPIQNELNQKACLESCLKHGYIFCLQIHKYIGVE